MSISRTSQSHPLQIGAANSPGGGLVGMTICPGKWQRGAATGSWDRNLETDLDAIVSWGAEILVSLIEPSEYVQLHVVALPDLAEKRMVHYKLPIADYSLPDEEGGLNKYTLSSGL